MCTGQQFSVPSVMISIKRYVLKVRQRLSGALKVGRLERLELLITSLKQARSTPFLTSIFHVDMEVIHQNGRCLCKDSDDLPVTGKTKLLARVHILKVISCKGDAMPPHFFAKARMQ